MATVCFPAFAQFQFQGLILRNSSFLAITTSGMTPNLDTPTPNSLTKRPCFRLPKARLLATTCREFEELLARHNCFFIQ